MSDWELLVVPPQPARNLQSTVSLSARPRVKAINRSQISWRSVDVEALIEQDHAARAIWEMTGRLALDAFYQSIQAVEGVAGRMAWDPRLLISLWLYAYSRGIGSARQIERLCSCDPAFQWLSGLETVNHHTLSDFRVQHEQALKNLFVELLAVLSAEGLISLKRVMHDGTKIRSNASRKSFRTEEALRDSLRAAREQVEALSTEQNEPLAGEQAAQQRAARERTERVEKALQQLEQIRESKSGAQKKKQARASTSDPEARIMKQAAGGYAPSYNVQISTEASHKVIVAVEVSQQGNDYTQLTPAVEQIKENMNAAPEQMVVDGGFTSRENILKMAEQGIDLVGRLPDAAGQSSASVANGSHSAEFARAAFAYDAVQDVYRCPAGESLKAGRQRKQGGTTEHFYQAAATACQSCAFKQQCCPRSERRTVIRLEEAPEIDAFRRKMQTPEAQQIYKQRAEVAEFPNAWLKEKLGLRRFRVRGLVKVKCEALWAALTYNIQQWIRLCWRPTLKASAR